MSGTNDTSGNGDALDRLEEVLDRREPMDALVALTKAMYGNPKSPIELGKVALGFDTNVFLRLVRHRNRDDILDYLPRHGAPVILPGQAIQEFWNNKQSVLLTVSTKIRKEFNDLASSARMLDEHFGEFESEFNAMLDRFDKEFGYAYDENTKKQIAAMLSALETCASCVYVPRGRFSQVAQSRKRTRTPPGFKDDGDGDFFIWADFLFGLLLHINLNSEITFDRVVLVTGDRKPDWSTKDIPHPILSAEVYGLFKVPFDLWTLDTFASEVRRTMKLADLRPTFLLCGTSFAVLRPEFGHFLSA